MFYGLLQARHGNGTLIQSMAHPLAAGKFYQTQQQLFYFILQNRKLMNVYIENIQYIWLFIEDTHRQYSARLSVLTVLTVRGNVLS